MASVDPNDLAGDLTQNLENSLKEEKPRNEADFDKKSFIKDDNFGINKNDYHENENSQHKKYETDVSLDEVEAGESDSDEDTCTKPDEDDIVVDEEYMKKLEEKMSEEEKQVKKDEAQELKANGNSHFKASEFQIAICSYTQALQTCPLCFQKERAIMYSNRAACRLHLKQYEKAIEDCTKALELNPNYLKALLRRAEMYEKTEKLDEALEDYKKVIEMDPTQHTAREACIRLPQQITERNEKMKDEMMGKLKELGNMVLRPFGMSTDNFKLQQDPNTGSYSVQFQQNAK